MVQILPARRTFGAEAGKALGGGIAASIASAREKKSQAEQLRGAEESKMNLFEKQEEIKHRHKLAQIEEKQKLIRDIYEPKKGKSLGEKLAEGEPETEPAYPKEERKEFPKLSETEMAELEFIQPGLGRLHQQAQESQSKETRAEAKEKRETFESERAFHTKVSDDILKGAQSVLNEAPTRRGLIAEQRRAIESNQTSGFLPFMAELTGLPMFRNPESAVHKTASKYRFVENLSTLGGGARPNQFIEQQLVSAQPLLGSSADAQSASLDLEEFVDDLKEQRSRFIMDLAQQDEDKYGYVRRDVARKADNLMQDYANQKQDEMAYKIRKRAVDKMSNEELARNLVIGKITPDTPLTRREANFLMIKNNYNKNAAQAEAERLGYRFPLEGTYEKFR